MTLSSESVGRRNVQQQYDPTKFSSMSGVQTALKLMSASGSGGWFVSGTVTLKFFFPRSLRILCRLLVGASAFGGRTN